MITRWTAKLNRVLRLFSPTEWFVRWLRMPRDDSQPQDRGLLLVQIDGLSRRQLQRAVDAGRMPFLKSLLTREHYRLYDFYSGLPSSTPSVQGELFYGVRCAVPAFGFRDRRTGEAVRMFSRDTAAEVEKRLVQADDGVLANGSAYCNIYSGGAKESHFCASSLGWSELLSERPWKLTVFLIWHFWSVVRMLGLIVIEFLFSLAGFVQGTARGREFWQELMMIPARVVVVILFRELSTIGASLDVVRGLPIVQLNLLGYDEQAHRRGPQSKFAHWTLLGIDRAIRRLWNAAHRSAGREYDVWIYSDHGQESTIPYEYITGKRISEVAADVVSFVCGESGSTDDARPALSAAPSNHRRDTNLSHGRARWLGASWIVGKLFGEEIQVAARGPRDVQVEALGPLGLIYTNRDVSHADRLAIAHRLVRECSVPIAFVQENNSAIAITPDGKFDLCTEPERVFGTEHPFLEDVARDMIFLCQHPDAGDVVVSGWVHNGDSLSFATQHGAHAGPGSEETHAFAMVPCDLTVELNNKNAQNNEHDKSVKRYLRPNDLHRLINGFAHSMPNSNHESGEEKDDALTVKVLTYNVHACIGMDAQLSPKRIARVIAQCGADIVALQEIDVFRARTGHRDQAEDIARLVQMECHFHPAWDLAEERYGDAILSRWPLRLVRTGQLPTVNKQREPRGAIWVELRFLDGRTIQVLNTHLSIYPIERNLQAEAFASDWVTSAKQCGTTIVCGDFNAAPRSPTYKCLHRILNDVQTYDIEKPPESTWFSSRPLARIDHIFVTEDIQVRSTQVVSSRLARVASDHLPLLADLHLPRSSESCPVPHRKKPTTTDASLSDSTLTQSESNN